MKNLMLVVIAAVTAAASSSLAAEPSRVNLCITKDSAERKITELPMLNIIMGVDKKFKLGAGGEKIASTPDTISYKGFYGPIDAQGAPSAQPLEVQIDVVTSPSGALHSVVISNNKTMSSAFEIVLKDLQKNPKVEAKANEIQPSECFSGNLTVVEGLSI